MKVGMPYFKILKIIQSRISSMNQLRINSYLTFNGNCRDAMQFYQKCFDADLKIQTVGESPLANHLPEKMKHCILHALLTKGELLLMGSDMVAETGLIKGSNVSLSLNCTSETEIRNYFEQLSIGGKVMHPLENTFWGALFGDLTDQFGNHWLLNFERNN